MSKIERVEERIHEILQDKLQSGESALVFNLGQYYDSEHCGCLAGVIAGKDFPRGENYEIGAAKILCISQAHASHLESGFENRPLMGLYQNTYYKLGQRIKEHYT